MEESRKRQRVADSVPPTVDPVPPTTDAAPIIIGTGSNIPERTDEIIKMIQTITKNTSPFIVLEFLDKIEVVCLKVRMDKLRRRIEHLEKK